MTDWNYGDIWETVAELRPDAVAVVQGPRQLRWREFDRRADGVARWLLQTGVEAQDKVALYLYNCPEYLEACFATFKIGLVPVNTNYRYRSDELAYLWDNADAVAVVFHGAFAERVEGLRSRLRTVKGWLWVDDGSGPCPEWATPYEQAATSVSTRVGAPWGRSGDDLIMIYTGGTTGVPKGVMWRQDDAFVRLNAGGVRHYPVDGGLAGLRRVLDAEPGSVALTPACPLMHGTGWFSTNTTLAEAGRVVLLEGRRFDAVELLTTIEAHQVNGLVIVGDPFARPIVATLDDDPERWDLSSLAIVISSGAMWSEATKDALLAHLPRLLLVDAFGSSEAVGLGVAVAGGGRPASTAVFTLGPDVRVLSEAGTEVRPGSDEVGVVALAGRGPIGYYKDEAATARTFTTIGGVRFSIPGDVAQVAADGTIRLLGRGSGCINSGGEKIFPEEVEEALKTHPAVRDAAVVALPHPTFGQQVAAIVELVHPAQAATSGTELIEHVKAQLASYKAPRLIRTVDSIGRAPNGKIDYARIRDEMTAWQLALSATP